MLGSFFGWASGHLNRLDMPYGTLDERHVGSVGRTSDWFVCSGDLDGRQGLLSAYSSGLNCCPDGWFWRKILKTVEIFFSHQRAKAICEQ